MQMMHPGLSPEPGNSPSLMVFRLGGRRLAARTDEVAGIRLCGQNIRIPSRTPYMNRLLRQEDEVLPVYDLGARLKLRPVGAPPFCLIAKHHKGKLAVCIDADLPILQSLSAVAVETSLTTEADVLGTIQIGTETIPVFSLAMLGAQRGIESLRI